MAAMSSDFRLEMSKLATTMETMAQATTTRIDTLEMKTDDGANALHRRFEDMSRHDHGNLAFSFAPMGLAISARILRMLP